MIMKTVSCIILNKEILQGAKEDNITPFLTKEFNILGYDVQKITILPENGKIVAYEIDIMTKHYDILVIVGGTKNGFIYSVLEKLFIQNLKNNEELESALCHDSGTERNVIIAPVETRIPRAAKILTDASTCYPLVYLQRIFILDQNHFQSTFTSILKEHLVQYRKEPQFVKKLVFHNLNGNSGPAEDLLLKLARNRVKIQFKRENQSLSLKISSGTVPQLLSFLDEIDKSPLQDVSVVDDFEDLECVHHSTDPLIRNTLESIHECFKQYSPKDVFLSFNGGKDCTVLLHLIFVVLRTRFPDFNGSILCLYVQSDDPFPEQEEFIDLCGRYYNLNVLTIRSGIKEALQKVLDERPNYKACFMGTRRTDPYSNELKVFQMTDLGWPQIMRVSPLLDWHYSDIWDYLLYYKVPYCKLYDWGYTSLGNRSNTIRNPSLLYHNIFEGREMYLPAYKLLNEGHERHGRNRTLSA